MHLPREVENGSLWSALLWEERDFRSDDLPMTNSILWPIGLSCCTSSKKILEIQSVSGMGLLNSKLGSFHGYRWFLRSDVIIFDHHGCICLFFSSSGIQTRKQSCIWYRKAIFSAILHHFSFTSSSLSWK